MGSKLQKNAIMVGYINSYCLVCECYFDTDEEASDHIQDSGHAGKLLAYPYLEKYGQNNIRKVNKGYFCEFCSVLLATTPKVTLHIQESTHFERKGTFLLRRPSGVSAVIAFDNLLIGERAWHSISEDTCAICNEEFDNENIHKTESSHLLKLVQSKVEFGPENSVYRKTDDSSFQCLTCNAVFALNTLFDHFTDPEHKQLYVKCQNEYKTYIEQNKSKTNAAKEKDDDKDKKHDDKDKKHDVKDKKDDVKAKIDDNKGKKEDVKDKIDDNKGKKEDVKDKIDDIKGKKEDVKDKIDDIKGKKENDKNKNKGEKNPVDKNHNDVKVNSKAKVEIEVNSEGIGFTVAVRKPTTTKPEPEDEATVFAEGNNLTYNAGNTNAFCRICETKLPATLRSMKEHVNGKEHKSRLGRVKQLAQAAKTKPHITKKPMNKFINFVLNIANIFGEDVVINDRYCISLHSFLMMTKVGGRYRCQVCEVTVFGDDVEQHAESVRHVRAAETTPILTSLPDSELVREVRAGIYHCAYCNLMVPRWEEVASHLQAREHKENKDECAWRLRRHMPAILEHRRQQEADLFRMIMMRQMFRH